MLYQDIFHGKLKKKDVFHASLRSTRKGACFAIMPIMGWIYGTNLMV